jgi:hypothetical protein
MALEASLGLAELFLIDSQASAFYNLDKPVFSKESRLMAKQQSDVNKSEEIRQLLRANPKMKAKDVVSTLTQKGIKVNEGQVYAVKGYMKGRKGRRKKARQMVTNVAATGNSDPVGMILKVKGWANEVGGMKELKALVDALSE